MTKTRVAVLRGGPSKEYDISLQTGGEVIKSLQEDKYDVLDVLIDKDKRWFLFGKEMLPSRILSMVDVAFNAMHGSYGEDGEVQKILDLQKIPYTGSGPLASAMVMNKVFAKKHLENFDFDIVLPKHILLSPNIVYDLEKEAKNIFLKFPPPYIVKPITGGSSLNTVFVRTVAELPRILEEILLTGFDVIVEEFIDGREITVGVLENFRDENVYTFIPVEIRKNDKNKVFGYEEKYTTSQKISFSSNTLLPEEKKKIMKASRDIHNAFGLRHYSRSDFILSKNGKLYFLETNSLPGMTKHSFLPAMAKEVGLPFDKLLEHIINLALNKI